MLNKDEETAQTSSTTESSKASNEGTVLKMGPTVMGTDLDDPDSLWKRPAKLYALPLRMQCITVCKLVDITYN